METDERISSIEPAGVGTATEIGWTAKKNKVVGAGIWLMWTLERGIETCRALNKIADPFGFSVALYGGVLVNGSGADLDLFLVPQKADADVAGCLKAIRDGLKCGVTGPFLGDWNRLMCQIRMRPDIIDVCPASSILSGQRQLEFPILFERYQEQSGLWAVGREENLLLVFLPFHRPAFSTALGRRIVIVEIITMVSWLPPTPSRRPEGSNPSLSARFSRLLFPTTCSVIPG
jgi:hypothetical protein